MKSNIEELINSRVRIEKEILLNKAKISLIESVIRILLQELKNIEKQIEKIYSQCNE